jgi:uncharacterized membrane protein (DUF2068 family)
MMRSGGRYSRFSPFPSINSERTIIMAYPSTVNSGKPGAGLAHSGVRVVAVVEAAKGVVILLAGFGLLALVHRGAQEMAEEIVGHLHLNPASRYPRIFIDLMGHLSDRRLWGLAVLALAYSSLRFLEAYGLWRERAWAEWLAVASGAIYLPFEIYELMAGVSPLKLMTFSINLAVVAYMAYVLRQSRGPAPAG